MIVTQALRNSGKSGISSEDMQRIKPWFANMMSCTGKSCCRSCCQPDHVQQSEGFEHVPATDPFPVYIPTVTAESSQGLKHELSLRVSVSLIYVSTNIPGCNTSFTVPLRDEPALLMPFRKSTRKCMMFQQSLSTM